MAMLPVSRRPRPLPADQLWIFLLLEMDTADTMEERCFLGERLLVRARGASAGVMFGELLTTAVMAPSLGIGDIVTFGLWGTTPVATAVLYAGAEEPIDIVSPTARSNAVGVFFASKQGGNLQPGNISCSNPSCGMVFSLTYSQFVASSEEQASVASATGTRAMCLLGCETCGTSRVVDHRTFDGIFKY